MTLHGKEMPFRFRDLPPELRNRVYEWSFMASRTHQIEHRGNMRTKVYELVLPLHSRCVFKTCNCYSRVEYSFSLLLVDKQTCTEVKGFVYANMDFQFRYWTAIRAFHTSYPRAFELIRIFSFPSDYWMLKDLCSYAVEKSRSLRKIYISISRCPTDFQTWGMANNPVQQITSDLAVKLHTSFAKLKSRKVEGVLELKFGPTWCENSIWHDAQRATQADKLNNAFREEMTRLISRGKPEGAAKRA